jgi:hypothetical protein
MWDGNLSLYEDSIYLSEPCPLVLQIGLRHQSCILVDVGISCVLIIICCQDPRREFWRRCEATECWTNLSLDLRETETAGCCLLRIECRNHTSLVAQRERHRCCCCCCCCCCCRSEVCPREGKRPIYWNLIASPVRRYMRQNPHGLFLWIRQFVGCRSSQLAAFFFGFIPVKYSDDLAPRTRRALVYSSRKRSSSWGSCRTCQSITGRQPGWPKWRRSRLEDPGSVAAVWSGWV